MRMHACMHVRKHTRTHLQLLACVRACLRTVVPRGRYSSSTFLPLKKPPNRRESQRRPIDASFSERRAWWASDWRPGRNQPGSLSCSRAMNFGLKKQFINMRMESEERIVCRVMLGTVMAIPGFSLRK
mmetsp:Transcript_34761/g.108116  ORF Transcript_34761/g.108116 Transcript_34761/m.108116 type:complete len:128 (+) Transcript_34761:69-452(+)